MIKKKIAVEDIISFLDKEVIAVKGSCENCYIDNIPDAQHVEETSLDWVNSSKANKQEIAENSPAKVLVVDENIEFSPSLNDKGKTLLVVKKPRKIMALVASHFFIKKQEPGIHPSAVIDEDADIDESAHISAGCVIGRAKIGKNTVLCFVG